MESTNKKRFITFIAVAYGAVALMCIFMYIGLKAGKDLSVFPLAHMLFPACGVIIGTLLFGDKEKKVPKAGFFVMIITMVVLLVMSLASISTTQKKIQTVTGEGTNWSSYAQTVIVIASVVCYVLFWVCGKEKRKNVGLSRNAVGKSILLVAVFIVLYFVRLFIWTALKQVFVNDGTNAVGEMAKVLFSPQSAYIAFSILITFPLSFTLFLGEEYGWRYYLQPILQKKFGLRRGVLILGVVWGIWHIGLDFMYYAVNSGPMYFVNQIINCIALAIFFGYAYMKTKNIWVVTWMHYINNNFALLFANGDTDLFQNQTVLASDLPFILLGASVLIVFIFAPIYKGKKDKPESEQGNEQNVA